jgi:hypothetical protein
MKPTRTRVVGIAAALSMIAIAAPASTAGAATTAPVITPVAIEAAGWDGLPAVTLAVTAPVAGQEATVIGPAIITTAPSSFINTNNQVSTSGTWSGGQFAG